MEIDAGFEISSDLAVLRRCKASQASENANTLPLGNLESWRCGGGGRRAEGEEEGRPEFGRRT